MTEFPKPVRAGRLTGWLVWTAACALLGVAAFGWWVWSGRIYSTQAALEASLLAVRAPLSEVVERIPVQLGEAVAAGVPVVFLRGDALAAHAEEADPLCRAAGAQQGNTTAAHQEQDVRARLILARHEEESLLTAMQESVSRHARLQYVLRAAQASGKVPQPEQIRAEEEARQAVAVAKARHEQASHARAVLSREAERLRNAPNVGKAGVPVPCPPTADLVRDLLQVTAPADGRVARVHVRAGESVLRGDMLVEILQDSEKSMVLAWLPAEQGEKVKVGQCCVLRGEGLPSVRGKVSEVLAPIRREVAATGLRGQDLRTKIGTEEKNFVPVRVMVDAPLPALPDTQLNCQIYTRSWPWLEEYLPLLP